MIRHFLFFTLFFLFWACEAPSNNDPITGEVSGEMVYKNYCLTCHGPKGNNKVANKLMLNQSELPDSLMRTKILYGAGSGMPAYKKMLSEEEVTAVIHHINTLRN